MIGPVWNGLAFTAYRGLAAAVRPFVPIYLDRRVRRGKEDPERLSERYGRASAGRPPGPLIWAHGASVGETLSIMPLLDRLTERGFDLLLTSGTLTSARLAARRAPAGVIHQFTPLDVPAFVSRFLNHWQPDLALFAESELWPNLILQTTGRGTPMILVNGRMSEASFRRWHNLKSVPTALLSTIDLCLAQSRDDAERFEALGTPRVTTTGNLKFDTPPPPADPREFAALSAHLAGRTVMLAASTHRGEEQAIFTAHRALREDHPQLFTIVVPRHPERGLEVTAVAEQEGLQALMRSRGHLPDAGTEVYVADTIGELGLFYRLAPIVFMGGSLVKHGGQNPIEPAKLDCAVLHGPHVFNFTEVYAALNQARGAATVADIGSLARSLALLLDNPETARRMALAARDTVGKFTGALDRTLAALDPYLIQLRLGRA
ncbi:3-deoxy-D-manno-octulosonic acid transferase [Blastochloris viridis]|uniref:3-deoxy-D-manno-octulosonic acid transferase n=1 Tax=Blastochloris viridis TaxID=1079 RepID=A0A0H5BCZ5_BLAVI|nr:3-deoxy-D-manno-octulosonic acid transferase [Blastochloris viridis]ALK08541.1 3-deoxy-D-manno-octulosonic acid transferase [Blastochloris viridis]BAR98171.1 lipid IVA 3-deoxy-D-manno-octulosonic acid transferase also] [Blastochloris viridis]CUU41204.1 3-deoxy-D-manno-octulosonic-acid transferase [Blastochloris viridis]